MKLQTLLLSLALLLAIPVAQAQVTKSATITCTGPTQYTDGTPIPAGKAATYTIYGGLQGATKQKLATSATCSFLRTNLTAGTQEWYVTATLDSVESPASITVSKVIVADQDGDGVPDASDACPTVKGTNTNGCPTPSSPVNVVVSDAVAYELKLNTTGAYVASRIGIVPMGLSCSQETRTASGVTYNRIDVQSVDLINWPAKIPPKDVFARCASG